VKSGWDSAPLSRPRPRAGGKFIFVGDRKLYIRGVAYGTFRPSDSGSLYPAPPVVDQDFADMAANGVNTVRTYTAPPAWLLDLASAHGLFVMVGVPWEQHVAFLDDPARVRSIEARVRAGVAACAGHPAVLAYVIGNEIPAPIVRWHGRRRVERFLERLYRAAKDVDPDALVTYANYPSTEYLQLPFVDFVSFNVYLEAQEELMAYLARLQNIAGDRPLLVTEFGLDSDRNGEEGQAIVLDWQVRAAFRAGCAGCVVFSWTDEWHRGGFDVEDWSFGLTDRERNPKPALEAVRTAFDEVPFPQIASWPRVSVVVCSHNGAETIGDCLEGLLQLNYPNHEVLVVDDGSTDATASVAERYGVRVIRTENRGLSSARTTGLHVATGEIVAYLDDDCRPDPDWLNYMVGTFMTTQHVGVGGPNISPAGGGVAACVANAPGGPIHVLVSDSEAEHIPGCNMAFRKDALVEIGGFDPQFRIAGDDVDVCWRLQSRGHTLGFSPSAMVWHRRRSTVRAYLRQQRGYGEAEAALERKWPAKYNRSGHVRWAGRVYTPGVRSAIGQRRWRVYYGMWGSGLFQSVYQRSSTLASLPLMPEWYLLLTFLAAMAGYELGVELLTFRVPLLGVPITLLAFVFGAAALVTHAATFGWNSFPGLRASFFVRARLRLLTAFLTLLQPLARLSGRMRSGLTPWRLRGPFSLTPPIPRTLTIWTDEWQSPADRLRVLESELGRSTRGAVVRGGDFDRWDLQVRLGALGVGRMRLVVEEHGEGNQLFRFRIWPKWSRGGVLLLALFALLLVLAFHRHSVGAYLIAATAGAWVLVRMTQECSAAIEVLQRAVAGRSDEPRQDLVDTLAVRVAATGRPGHGSGAKAALSTAPVGDTEE
jgi:glycosyltransferase involved in cell wall biosynthesis